MSLWRRAAKRDANEPPIIEALVAVGATIMQGRDVDLIVGFRGRNFLLEVKPEKGGRLKPSQELLLDTWRGQYGIVRTPQEALQHIGASST
jgi:hypothetical protein